ncbi:MAG: alpha/beta hydrolase [Anaerolineales bacterium]
MACCRNGRSCCKPIILLPGFPEFWYSWRHQILVFVESGFRVIATDHSGYNLSDCPHGTRPYRLDYLGRDILSLIDPWGYEKVGLVGHDWGAGVAWWIAVNFPGRINHLAILNVTHLSVMMETLRKSPRQMLKSWYILFFQIPALADWLLRLNNFFLVAKMLRSSGKSTTFTDEDIHEYHKAWTNSGGLTGTINWYRSLVRQRLPETTEIHIHVPKLILWGKLDVALTQDMAQKSINLCDNGQLKIFDDATHWVQHDSAPAVNRELVEFFK